MFRVQANTLDEYFNADQARKGDLQASDALIRETVPDLARWFDGPLTAAAMAIPPPRNSISGAGAVAARPWHRGDTRNHLSDSADRQRPGGGLASGPPSLGV